MKDLYTALGIESSAGSDEIEAALERNPALEEAARILLDPERRAVYDSNHQTLRMIGTLRHRLGMDGADSWFTERHPDFVPVLNRR